MVKGTKVIRTRWNSNLRMQCRTLVHEVRTLTVNSYGILGGKNPNCGHGGVLDGDRSRISSSGMNYVGKSCSASSGSHRRRPRRAFNMVRIRLRLSHALRRFRGAIRIRWLRRRRGGDFNACTTENSLKKMGNSSASPPAVADASEICKKTGGGCGIRGNALHRRVEMTSRNTNSGSGGGFLENALRPAATMEAPPSEAGRLKVSRSTSKNSAGTSTADHKNTKFHRNAIDPAPGTKNSSKFRGGGGGGGGLLMGCNPCGGSGTTAALEEHKVKIPAARSISWERQKSWRTITRIEDGAGGWSFKNVVLKKKRSSSSSKNRGEVSRVRREPSSTISEVGNSRARLSTSTDCSSYRLSTSSGEAGHWECGRFSWDRDASFASDDDCDDFELMDRIERCSLEDPVDLWLQQRKNFPSPEEISHLQMPRPGIAARPPASPQMPSPGNATPNQMPSDGIASPLQIPYGGISSPEEYSIPSKDDASASSTGMEELGKAVRKESEDPYEDYMHSVIDMVAAYNLRDPVDLHRLLQAYLSLNPGELHGTIVDVFDDVYDALHCI